MGKQVVVIGAGVVGLCVALHAARRGHRVTVVDRAAADHRGCSHVNVGMITPSHFVPLAAPGMVALGLRMMWNPASPFYIRPTLRPDLLGWGWRFCRAATRARVERAAPLMRDLLLASRALHEELDAASGGGPALVEAGLLMLCKSERTLGHEAAIAEHSRRLGMPAEVLDPRRTAEVEPGIRFDIAGSVYYPLDGSLTPEAFMATLGRAVVESGAAIERGAGVTGWRSEGARVRAVTTTRGEFAGDEFVLAAGAWSPGLGRSLGLRLPMQAGKGYSLTLTKPRSLPRICSVCTEARVAATPMGASLRFGGTMEIAGMGEGINPVRVRGIIGSVCRYFPDFTPDDFAGVEAVCGLRPVSADGLPYIGRFAAYPNLIAACGHAMLGVTLGPITGRLVAEVLCDQEPSIPLADLSPDRCNRAARRARASEGERR